MCSRAATSPGALGAVACAAILTHGAASRADASTSAAADALFQQGRSLLEAKRFEPACEKLAASHRLDPAPGTLALLAYCHEQRGLFATARREYLRAAEGARAAGQSDRERTARRQADALGGRVPTLRIEASEPAPGLELTRAGQLVPPAQWGVPVAVDPGRVVVEARAPGRKPWRAELDLPPQAIETAVKVPALAAERAPAQPAPPEPSSDRTLAWLTLAVGAAGIGAGSYFGLRARGRNDDSLGHCDEQNRCDEEGLRLRDDAQQAATLSNVAFGVGLVAAGAGVALLLGTGSGGEARAPRVLLAAELAPGATVTGARLSF